MNKHPVEQRGDQVAGVILIFAAIGFLTVFNFVVKFLLAILL